MSIFLDFLALQKEVEESFFRELKDKYPLIKFRLDRLVAHPPLEEKDAGFSARYTGNDMAIYDVYKYFKHPNNFMDQDTYININRFTDEYYFK